MKRIRVFGESAFSAMTISVLIPSYLRPDNLVKCLDALKQQTHRADQVVVVVRDTDTATRDFLRDYPRENLPLTETLVAEPGGINAYNRGLDAATGDIVAITDDDTVPPPHWLQRILAHYHADPLVGGVGGLDIQPPPQPPYTDQVGLLQWWGRMIGNHHLGKGAAREVDFIKGANCSYRTALLRQIGFDKRLLGKGAQVHFEIVIGLAFRRAGWKLIYDPDVVLHHYPAARHDYDQRGKYNHQAQFDMVHNGTLAVYEHLSLSQRTVFVPWSFALGTKVEPGVLMSLYLLLRDRRALQKIAPTLAARFAGIQTAHRTKRPETVSPDALPTLAAPVSVTKG